MRITGNRIIDLSAASVAKNQEAVGIGAGQVSSGMRVTKPSDDPTAWAAAERARVKKTIAQGAGAAVQESKDQLDQTDNAFAALGDVLTRVRELAITGATATYNASDRIEMGVEAKGLFTTALGTANTQATNGEYLLAGSSSLALPFDPTGAYRGDSTARQAPIGGNTVQQATVAGSRLTAAYGVDVLPLINKIATALSTNDISTLQSGLGDLDTAIKQVSLARTFTGGAMNVMDQTVAARDALSTHLSTEISRNVELDTISAASDLAKASQSLEASRAVSAHVISILSSNQ